MLVSYILVVINMNRNQRRIYEYKKKNKDIQKRINNNDNKNNNNILIKWLFKLFIVIIITLITMIILKTSDKIKKDFYKYVYTTNFSFTTINKEYQKLFGTPIPFQNLLKKPVETVFEEKLIYKSSNLYKDGVKLEVDNNYLVPIIESGLVVFIGEKEDYGNVVIIQGMNGIDTWYGNVEEVNVKLYDYVSKGTLLGNTKDSTLYLLFQKEGKILNYKDHLPT